MAADLARVVLPLVPVWIPTCTGVASFSTISLTEFPVFAHRRSPSRSAQILTMTHSLVLHMSAVVRLLILGIPIDH